MSLKSLRFRTFAMLMVLMAACGNSGSDVAAERDFDPACVGLADRWQGLQQGYLDRLGDASTAEVSEGSDRVNAAGQWIGGALLEQARDATAVGCEADLVSGAPLLCARVDALDPTGPAATEVVDALRTSCVDEQDGCAVSRPNRQATRSDSA